MEWWGHHKEHGWVVLDRSIPCNAPGIKADLQFLRCRDAKILAVKREHWNPPLFQFAANYIRQLPPAAAAEAAAEFGDLQDRWPEFQWEIRRHWQEAEERAEAGCVQEKAARRQAASDKQPRLESAAIA